MSEVTKFIEDFNLVTLITLFLSYCGGCLTLYLRERIKNKAYAFVGVLHQQRPTLSFTIQA